LEQDPSVALCAACAHSRGSDRPSSRPDPPAAAAAAAVSSAMQGGQRSRHLLATALAALLGFVVSPSSALDAANAVPTTTGDPATAPGASTTPEAPGAAKRTPGAKPSAAIPKFQGKAPMKPTGKPPSVGSGAQAAKAAAAARAAGKKGAPQVAGKKGAPQVPAAKPPPVVPVTLSAIRVQVPKRDSVIGKNKMNEQIPSCTDFDACVNQGTTPEKCCATHLQSTSRTCGICAKAACILRSDWCRRADRAKETSDKDAYCELCFDMADKEKDDKSKTVNKLPAAAAQAANFYPSSSKGGVGGGKKGAWPKPAPGKKKGPPKFGTPPGLPNFKQGFKRQEI